VGKGRPGAGRHLPRRLELADGDGRFLSAHEQLVKVRGQGADLGFHAVGRTHRIDPGEQQDQQQCGDE